MARKRHRTKYPGIYYRLLDEERPDGPRRYIIFYTDANGKGHTETLGVGYTLEDARLRKGSLDRQRRTYVPTNHTVGSLLDEYLGLMGHSVKAKTLDDYRHGAEVVKDELGSRKLKDLTVNDCASLIATLQKRGYKTWSVKKILTPLQGSMRVAVREGWIQGNPLANLLPHERPKDDQREMRCLGNAEITLLLDNASTDRWKTLFATLLFTGLRISEALALEWKDIDLQKQVISVREGKTDAAKRDVPIMDGLARRLRHYRMQGWPTGYVFKNRNDGAVSRREALRALRAAEKRAGIPEYTLHELRHTFASILISEGEPVTLVAKLMGHKDPSITLKTYAHLFDAQANVQRAMDTLQAKYGGVV